MPPWLDDEVQALVHRTRPLLGSPDSVLFYGSSSFTLWHDLPAHFPGYRVINHGFGGSTLADCLEYFPLLVAPVAPRIIILYAGDNDLANGASAEQLLDLLRAFILRKREALGRVPLAFVSVKISPARFAIMHRIAYANLIISRALQEEGEVTFVDITRRMTGRGFGALMRYYGEDALHMNADGYRVLGKSLAEYLELENQRQGGLRTCEITAKPVEGAKNGDADMHHGH